MKVERIWIAGVIAAGMAAAASGQPADSETTVRDKVYSQEQSKRGRASYDGKCASCHGSMDSVTPDMAPLLNDSGFQNLWRDRSLAQLFERIRETMPQDNPNTLSPEETAALVAYILSGNQLPAGQTALPTDLEILKEIRVDAGEP